MSNMVLRGTNELPWHRRFEIGVTLDAFLKFLKSGTLMGHLKEVLGGPGGIQVLKIVLWGVNELPWPRGFQIGVTLDEFLKFLKSGALRGHLTEVYGGPGDNQVSNMVLWGANDLSWPREF